jgi:hypothetical protein
MAKAANKDNRRRLNLKGGTDSYLPLKCDEKQPDFADGLTVTVRYTGTPAQSWTGTLVAVSAGKRFGYAKLTAAARAAAADGPERTDERVTVTIDGTATPDVKVDLYDE